MNLNQLTRRVEQLELQVTGRNEKFAIQINIGFVQPVLDEKGCPHPGPTIGYLEMRSEYRKGTGEDCVHSEQWFDAEHNPLRSGEHLEDAINRGVSPTSPAALDYAAEFDKRVLRLA